MANDHGIRSSTGEQRARDKDAGHDYVVSGGRPLVPDLGLQLPSFPTKGYVTNGIEHAYVDQIAAAPTLASIEGTHWLALAHNKTDVITDWDRNPEGSHYLTRQLATNPGHPVGGQLLAQLEVDGAFEVTAATYLSPSTPRRTIDPINFGADPTGLTLSTDAFQAAADALGYLKSYLPQGVTTSLLTTQYELHIPPGYYRLDKKIVFDGTALTINGHGAIIEMTDPLEDIFELENAYFVRVGGLRLAGGKRSFSAWNNNLDAAQMIFDDCIFQLAADWAIDTTSPTGDQPKSTMCIIRGCRFIANRRVFKNQCDNGVVENCWVFQRAEQMPDDTAVFENNGFLHCSNMFGVPADKTGHSDYRWFDNSNSLFLRESRCGGEFGGMEVIRNFGHYEVAPEPPNFLGNRIVIQGCEIFDNTAGKGIINIYEAPDGHPGVPAYVSIRNNLGGVDTPWIARDTGVTDQDIIDYLALIVDPHLKFTYDIDPNMDRASGIPPQPLRFFLIYERATWVPDFTFATPGALSKTFSTQRGSYTKYNNIAHLSGVLQTSAFTHDGPGGTSGSLSITNLPFVVVTDPDVSSIGTISFGGITKAGYTQFNCQILDATSSMTIIASGSGLAPLPVTAVDMPSGASVFFNFYIQMKLW